MQLNLALKNYVLMATHTNFEGRLSQTSKFYTNENKYTKKSKHTEPNIVSNCTVMNECPATITYYINNTYFHLHQETLQLLKRRINAKSGIIFFVDNMCHYVLYQET